MFKELLKDIKKFFQPFINPDCVKDLFFMAYATIWLCSAILGYVFTKDIDFVRFVIHNSFIVAFCVIVLMKIYNKRFRNWLNTKI